MKRTLPILVLLLLVVAGGLGTVRHALPHVRGFLDIPRGSTEFYDFRLFNGVVVGRLDGKPLYKLDQRNYYEPGSAVYKYPPPYAALLSYGADRRWRPVARRFLLYDMGAILLAWGLFVSNAFLRPRRTSPWWDPAGPASRSLGLLALLVLWKPLWESLAGIQLEPLFLPLLALALIGLERGWNWFEGVVVGACAVLKVYPALLCAGVVAERRWRPVLAGALAGLGLLVFGALRFSWGETWLYFSQVLPHLGGTSLSRENVSALGQIGQLVLGPGANVERTVSSFPTLETVATPPQLWIVWILALLLVGGLIATSWRTLSTLGRDERSPLRFALSIPLVLLILPTSWFDYQSLLFVPAAWLFLTLPYERRFLPTWIVFGVSLLPLLFFDANSVPKGELTPVWVSSGRALASVGIWASVVLNARTGARSGAGVGPGEKTES